MPAALLIPTPCCHQVAPTGGTDWDSLLRPPACPLLLLPLLQALTPTAWSLQAA